MTPFMSGKLMITAPNGKKYIIFSDDKQTLAFGGFGSFILDCDGYYSYYSSPSILKNSAVFCQKGTYIFEWENSNLIDGKTLKKSWTVQYDGNKFEITNKQVKGIINS